MRITLGRKLAAVIGLLSLVAAGISAFALVQAEEERQRNTATEAIWNAGLQARTLAQAIEHAVVQATAIYTAEDKDEAKGRLSALQAALADVERARAPFLAAMETELSPERRRKLDLAVTEFIAYQTDTAELGLTVSPKAALIQATDEATVKNRERMVAQIDALGRDVLARLDAQRATAAQARRRATLTLLAVPAAALGVALLVAFWIVGTQIQRPLRRLQSVMQALAADRLDETVPFASRRDEVGAMAGAIAAFREALIEKRALDADARSRATRDAEQQGDLAEAVRAFRVETEQAVATLALSAEEMQSAADALSGASSDTSVRTVVVARASEQSAAVVDGVASAAEELSNSAREIEGQVLRTSEIAAVALCETRGLETTVAALGRAAREIGTVVTLIRSVADQTNLLALNATIEAARAGTAGRGFAIVAAEVKALASQTAHATDRITLQVDAIQTAAGGTAGAIGAIGQTIAQMSDIAAAVALAAGQQGRASGEIARSIASAAAQARTVSDSIESVQAAAAVSAAQAGQVRANAGRVSAGSHGLQTAVAAFLDRVRAA
ncbi:MAG: methyl-accepting chemotaxis protein [Methylobacterium organophilum]|nr:methyl-accepting chemotaxis protein [Methylobacterium organophilum]